LNRCSSPPSFGMLAVSTGSHRLIATPQFTSGYLA
jgi:hypothetical protein